MSFTNIGLPAFQGRRNEQFIQGIGAGFELDKELAQRRERHIAAPAAGFMLGKNATKALAPFQDFVIEAGHGLFLPRGIVVKPGRPKQ